MKLIIEHMVSLRCKLVVKAELEKLGICYKSIELGEVILAERISTKLAKQLNNELNKSGLEIMHDENVILVEKIINIIVEMVHYADEVQNDTLSFFP